MGEFLRTASRIRRARKSSSTVLLRDWLPICITVAFGLARDRVWLASAHFNMIGGARFLVDKPGLVVGGELPVRVASEVRINFRNRCDREVRWSPPSVPACGLAPEIAPVNLPLRVGSRTARAGSVLGRGRELGLAGGPSARRGQPSPALLPDASTSPRRLEDLVGRPQRTPRSRRSIPRDPSLSR